MEYLPLIVYLMTWMVLGRVLWMVWTYVDHEGQLLSRAAATFLAPACVWVALVVSSLFVSSDLTAILRLTAFPYLLCVMTAYGALLLMESRRPAIFAMAVVGYVSIIGVFFLSR